MDTFYALIAIIHMLGRKRLEASLIRFKIFYMETSKIRN